MNMTACHIKKMFLFLLMFFAGSQGLWAKESTDTHYRGAYAQDLVWEGEVTMTGDVLILQGATLTVKPGTRVHVIPSESTKIDPEYLSAETELLIRGSLDIQGTQDSPVYFIPRDRDKSDSIAWAGITLDHAVSSRIAHAFLERADMAIRCVNSSPDIVGNQISSSRYGIVAQEESHPEILDNTIVDGEGGVFCWRSSNPKISGNRVLGHDEEALFVDWTSRPKLSANLISGNAIGLAIYPRDLELDLNSVTGNAENLRWLGQDLR
jgi:parallel beta-helix repeat protein